MMQIREKEWKWDGWGGRCSGILLVNEGFMPVINVKMEAEGL